MDVDSSFPSKRERAEKMTNSKKKRMKKLESAELLKAARADRLKKKPKPQEPRVSSSIELPTEESTDFTSSLDTEEKFLKAARSRLSEISNNVLLIRPVPKTCPPSLLKDKCPIAKHVRFPSKSGAGYAFLHFRNPSDLQSGLKMLADKTLKNQPIKAVNIGENPEWDSKKNNDWTSPSERQLVDFDWSKLFVTLLPRATTRFELAQVFRRASGIQLDTFDDGSCRGNCVLSYRSPVDALQAFKTRHGTSIRGSPIYVNFVLKRKTGEKSKLPRPVDLVAAESATRADAKEKPSKKDRKKKSKKKGKSKISSGPDQDVTMDWDED